MDFSGRNFVFGGVAKNISASCQLIVRIPIPVFVGEFRRVRTS